MSQDAEEVGKPVRFMEGDIIYEQDSESEGVYMILDGQVDIWRHEGDSAHHIASIGGGGLLGEVSVIEKRKHSVTAKASKLTNALFIAAPAFRRSFADPLVRHVVHTLATRLRSSYTAKDQSPDTPAKPVAPKSSFATIEGASRLVADRFLTFVEIRDFPFVVGKIGSNAKHVITGPASLRIPLIGIPELSDNHFEIIRREGELHIRDLGGPHGTIANGVTLSKYSLSATARLKEGRNEIVAGGAESPVRFIITVPENLDDT